MLDAVVRGMFTPLDEVTFTNTNTNTNTNTISGVLCISEYISLKFGCECLGLNIAHLSVSKDAEKFKSTFVLLYLLTSLTYPPHPKVGHKATMSPLHR